MIEFKNILVMIVDQPTTNTNRIYPRSEIEHAIKSWENKPLCGYFVGTNYEDISKVVITCNNLHFQGNSLLCDLKVLDTPNGLTLQTMIRAGHRFELTPGGYGCVGYDNVISKYELEFLQISLAG